MLNENVPTIPSEKVKKAFDWLDEKEKQEMLKLLQGNGKINITDLWEPGVENSWEVQQSLQSFRKAWQEKIYHISDDSKESIVKAAEKIPVNVETESDGSRLIKFKLWWKTWKILDPKLDSHTDDGYKSTGSYESINKITRNEVKLWWMMWDDVSKWENKKLAKYVQEKQREWLHIAKIEDMKNLLWELGKQANLSSEADQIAMLMYLTWMDWVYWLSMWDDKKSNSKADSRSKLLCIDDLRWFDCNGDDYYGASLCMIACE